MKTSLIVSTYNWPAALNLVLKSILKQSVLPEEVLIADDGSKQETIELISRHQKLFPVPLYHVWHEDDGFRKTIILNKSYEKATGDYIIQIDGDILLHKDFIKDHIKNRKSGFFIKGSRGRLDKRLTEEVLKSERLKFFSIERGIKSQINATRLPFLSPLFFKNDYKSRNVKGCNFALWKDDFVAINGYDNSISGWGHEDIDIAARLINYGIRRRQLKMTAVCYHLHHEIQSRSKEAENLENYYRVVRDKIVTCQNGYHQITCNP
jgi:glycosyltransferase involved in cell wall biosynthesis